MKSGVSSYCFNPLFTKNRIFMMEAIMFVGTKPKPTVSSPSAGSGILTVMKINRPLPLAKVTKFKL